MMTAHVCSCCYQEKMDAHYIATKAGYIRPRHYKERALLEMEAAVGKRFQPLLALCGQHGQTNCQVGGVIADILDSQQITYLMPTQ